MLPAVAPDSEKLVLDSLDIARSEAWKYYARSGADPDEVKAVAYEGLCRAAARYPAYCAEHGYRFDPDAILRNSAPGLDGTPRPGPLWGLYARTVVAGRLKDWARQNDSARGMPRSSRHVLQQIAAVLPSGGSDAEAAAAAGLTEAQVKRARSAEAIRPVSLDAVPNPAELPAMADQSTDIESAVVAGSITGAMLRELRAQGVEAQFIVCQHIIFGTEVEAAGLVLGLSGRESREVYQTAILACHDEMTRAALDTGNAPGG